jgi:hypothetical protein
MSYFKINPEALIMKSIVKTVLISLAFSIFAWGYFEVMNLAMDFGPGFIEYFVEFLGGPVVFLSLTYGIVAAVVLVRSGHFDSLAKIIVFVVTSGMCHSVIYKIMVSFAEGDTVFAVLFMLIAAAIVTTICTIALFIFFWKFKSYVLE